MALVKTPVQVNFSKGVNNKADPNQLAVDSFTTLENSVFDKAGRLTKRNGFGKLTQLPNSFQTNLVTLNNNLIATGSELYAFSQETNQWLDQGTVQPVSLKTQAILRSATSQSSPDTAVSDTGLICLVYVDNGVSYYQISDSNTGQQIVQRTALPPTAVSPRVLVFGNYFTITYIATISGTPHLQHISIPMVNPSAPRAAADISTLVSSLSAGYDAVVANNRLYVSYSSTSTTVRTTYLSSTFVVATAVAITSHSAALLSLVADTTTATPTIYVTFWESGSTNGFVASYSANLIAILAPTQVITGVSLNALTTIASNSVLTIAYETNNTYSYSPNAKTDYISTLTVTSTGTASSTTVLLRSVGLASKLFVDTNSGKFYVFVAYGESNQPTYFLINLQGTIVMRLAYANGGGYQTTQVLPTVSTSSLGNVFPYLLKDFLATVNKGTNVPAGTPSNAIYTQTGINIARFSINETSQYASEIASALHLTGGQLWMYDSVKPVEHGFHVWPENVTATTATGSGSIAAGTYYYAFTYEWTDNQGNLHRSAPSIPVAQVTTTANSTNTINVPTLRLTAKISPNPVRIVGYRWSVAQQTYYQFTSITSPIVNDITVDSIPITDTKSDLQILGQTLLYTTGGVIENIAAPASIGSALFQNRLFLIDAEDQNLIWYSKQIIENTPVELSDLLTLYVAPTTGSQGSTGPISALSAMDDKLIIFKQNAIYYLTGKGPDNTGAANDFTDPVFVASSVGCSNPNSIVLTPNGLMFQSDKGIWLLSRDLNTSYIGAAVENYNQQTIVSAKVIPATTQVRFLLSDGGMLMYDYFYGQWGTFSSNLSTVSSTLYNSVHTYLAPSGDVFTETPGVYLDGSKPVLMSFTTAWINAAGLQGYERLYQLYLLGKYVTPFFLNVAIAYDYNSSSTQIVSVRPDNYAPTWGGDSVWGGTGPWGGPGNVFEARVFPQKQKCESFQLTVTEQYNSTLNQAAGAGLTLSGITMVIGSKKGYRVNKASTSFG